MPDALTLFHGEAYESSSCLRRDRIVDVAGPVTTAFEIATVLFSGVQGQLGLGFLATRLKPVEATFV